MTLWDWVLTSRFSMYDCILFTVVLTKYKMVASISMENLEMERGGCSPWSLSK